MIVVRGSLFILAVASLLACRDQRSSTHVFHAPAPPAPATRAPQLETVSTLSQLPPGTMGPMASIEGVADAATGEPVALHELRGPVDVLVMAARGPNRPRSESSALLLQVRGARDTALRLPLDVPPPSIVAHRFRLPVGPATGLGAGRYSLQIRLVASGDTIASSIPLPVTVLASPDQR